MHGPAIVCPLGTRPTEGGRRLGGCLGPRTSNPTGRGPALGFLTLRPGSELSLKQTRGTPGSCQRVAPCLLRRPTPGRGDGSRGTVPVLPRNSGVTGHPHADRCRHTHHTLPTRREAALFRRFRQLVRSSLFRPPAPAFQVCPGDAARLGGHGPRGPAHPGFPTPTGRSRSRPRPRLRRECAGSQSRRPAAQPPSPHPARSCIRRTGLSPQINVISFPSELQGRDGPRRSLPEHFHSGSLEIFLISHFIFP